MVDPMSVYSDIPHPSFFHYRKSYDLKRRVKHYTRTRHPTIYYIIDFDMATRYGPDNLAPMDLPFIGGDKTVPEFQNARSGDVFNVYFTDIYYLGNMFRALFTQVRP